MKKKSKPLARVRRNPYERALEQAEVRHAKALQEHRQCVDRLTQLTDEIPKLEEVIRGLQAYARKRSAAPPPEFVTGLQHMDPQSILALPRINVPPQTANPPSIPAALQHFFTPHPSAGRQVHAQGGAVHAAGVNDEEFLPDDIPGVEVLP